MSWHTSGPINHKIITLDEQEKSKKDEEIDAMDTESNQETMCDEDIEDVFQATAPESEEAIFEGKDDTKGKLTIN